MWAARKYLWGQCRPWWCTCSSFHGIHHEPSVIQGGKKWNYWYLLRCNSSLICNHSRLGGKLHGDPWQCHWTLVVPSHPRWSDKTSFPEAFLQKNLLVLKDSDVFQRRPASPCWVFTALSYRGQSAAGYTPGC